MKCKNKEVLVDAAIFIGMTGKQHMMKLRCLCTNDEKGKTLSIDNGIVQFSVPMDDLIKYFTEDE